jgi:hypothetical protein
MCNAGSENDNTACVKPAVLTAAEEMSARKVEEGRGKAAMHCVRTSEAAGGWWLHGPPAACCTHSSGTAPPSGD